MHAIRRAILGGLALGVFAGGVANAQGPAREPRSVQWVDVHVHLLGGRPPRADFDGAVRAALAAMNDAGIRTSVVMPPPQVQSMPAFDWQDYAGFLKGYPGRFAFLGGGGTLNVMLHEAARASRVDDATRAEFERIAVEILGAGAAGFGEIAAHHLSFTAGHPYEWVAPDHPLLRLLADIAARRDAVIDLHLDVVPQDTTPPPRFQSPPNPPMLRENLAAFERLLAHSRNARIVWAHAGSDPLGHWTPALSRELLRKHPNLSMSLRIPAGMPGAARIASNFLLGRQGEINPDWLQLLAEFPDRFVVGGDQFIPSPNLRGEGPGLSFARLAAPSRERTRRFLEQLPADLSRRIAIENAARLYKLEATR